MVNNTWLAVYGKRINELIYQLETHVMMNTAGGIINLNTVCTYLTGAVKEIQKIEKENEELRNDLNNLYKKCNINKTKKEK